jgi:hypothetical protein
LANPVLVEADDGLEMVAPNEGRFLV